MFAVIRTGGKQYRVAPEDKIKVDKLPGAPGEIIENGLKAEREGYDAFLIGNIFEPGLHALRELLNIPVLGLCEASVHLACLMGAKFSVINVNAKFAVRVAENIAATARRFIGPKAP